MNTFKLKTTIHFGKNSLSRLEKIPYKRVMIITDSYMVSSNMIDLVTQPLNNANIAYTIFSDIVPDAPLDKITKGVEEFVKYRPDAIITIGGGSAIDSAKAIKEFGQRVDSYGDVGFIAIPTTSGTGSEVTAIAVVNDTQAHVKYPLVLDSMIPDEAILDAALVTSVPPSITADTGVDVLTHSIEAYVSSNHNEFASALAEKSIEMVGEYLYKAFTDGQSMKARSKVHIASCFAGIAFNAVGLGLNHGMAHQLGAKFKIPHGRANAILLPHIIRYNARIGSANQDGVDDLSIAHRYRKISRMLDINSYSSVLGAKALVNWIEDLLDQLEVTRSIREYGNIDHKDYISKIDQMADAALKDACTLTNPRTPTKEDVIRLYNEIW